MCVAYSNDKGQTWTKYSGNPVLPLVEGGNRGPKVFWCEPGKKWIFYSGDAYYLIGSFDGTTFAPESGPRILMAHTSGGGKGAQFRGASGMPVELTLRTTDTAAHAGRPHHDQPLRQ